MPETLRNHRDKTGSKSVPAILFYKFAEYLMTLLMLALLCRNWPESNFHLQSVRWGLLLCDSTRQIGIVLLGHYVWTRDWYWSMICSPLWRHDRKTTVSLMAGRRWIPHTKASDAELWCFLWSAPWINGWVNNREAGDLIRHRAHYDVVVMSSGKSTKTFSSMKQQNKHIAGISR